MLTKVISSYTVYMFDSMWNAAEKPYENGWMDPSYQQWHALGRMQLHTGNVQHNHSLPRPRSK